MKSRILLLGLALVVHPLAAQTDYRNLDAERPLHTEDAYPIERGSFELALGLSPMLAGGNPGVYTLEPELTLGLDNAQLSLAWPYGHSDGDGVTPLGPRLSFLYDPFTQSRRWPALAFRVSAAAVDGNDLNADIRVTGKLIATRSFGVTRLHLNAAFTAGPEAPRYTLEYPERAVGTIALDRTLWRQSLLVGVEGGAAQEMSGEDPHWLAGAGLRWQWTPTLVLDLGLRVNVPPAGRAQQVATFGISRSVGRGRPSTRAAAAHPTRFERRDDQFYSPGAFNWAFLRDEPDAARLFNAFDYGHAVLYERLLTERGAAREASLAGEYRFLTQDLLVAPPRFQMAEEAVMPEYAAEFWRAKQVFEWAHVLHRQIYDVYAYAEATSLGPQATDSMIEALTDRYLERREYALAPVPKAMELMDGQRYSGVFARLQSRFNGLIWAYHWLQVGLYEPYARRSLERGVGRGEGVAPVVLTGVGRSTPPDSELLSLAPVVARFRQMLATERFPQVMPMTSAVAPVFTEAHPRAAAIFDNLHALHDVISDILLNDDVVPRAGKRAAVWRALAEYQDASANVEADEHWRMMGEMVGGVERMGGAVP